MTGGGGAAGVIRSRVERGSPLSLRGRDATSLTGKDYSAQIWLSADQLDRLRDKHGESLENWWQQRFGHGFDCLTQSEARYLANIDDAHEIRDRIAAAEQAGDLGAVQGVAPRATGTTASAGRLNDRSAGSCLQALPGLVLFR